MLLEKENTEEKIIRAAFKIIQREGVAKATTKKIAAEAGVNEVTIFRKFENKKNLVEKTKEFYKATLISKLENTFDFDEDANIEEYIKNCFNGILSFTEDDFSIVRVAMQEVQKESDKKLLIAEITDSILFKLEEFFKLQMDKGIIKKMDPTAVALLCFSLIFQSLILWQIYGDIKHIESDAYANDFFDIIFNGIKPQ